MGIAVLCDSSKDSDSSPDSSPFYSDSDSSPVFCHFDSDSDSEIVTCDSGPSSPR